MDHLQKDEQKHAYLLYASGHLLALYKCIFYYYQFKLKGTKFVHTNQEECPGKLHLRPKFGGHAQEIRRLGPDDAHETLGCFISISNDQTKQFNLMKKIIKEWVRKIQSSPLSNSDKLTAYKHYLEAKMLHVLPVCSFTYKQCIELDKLLSPLLLNIHGVQRNANRNIIYMSEEFGGMRIYGVYHLQGTAKIQFFFKHYREQDTTGKLILTSLRYTQLESGLSRSFFKHDFYKVQHLVTPTWLTNLWQYMTECHTQIHESEPWLYNVPRQHDFFPYGHCTQKRTSR